ncbi:MAG: N-acetyltransferase [Balneola sp.]|nr:MAG: N-acetyltransferase [Balneola sp.]
METERLKLRLINEEDANFLFRLMNTEKWHLNIGDRNITSDERAREYMNSRMSPVLEEKGFINHVMIEKKSGDPVGTCSIHDRNGVDGLDIGYALLSEFEGLGYATEGALMMVKVAFERFEQEEISAITTDNNTVSCKVLDRLGFRHQSYIKLPDGNEELKLYTLGRKEFEERSN